MIVEKFSRRLSLYRNGKILKTYKIALGRNPAGPKIKEGDKRTPEGIYHVDYRNSGSMCYKSLHLSYPNKEDRARAETLGMNPGGDITIHGISNGYGWIGPFHRLLDWTVGCIAVTNREMNELWWAVPDGTVVEILT